MNGATPVPVVIHNISEGVLNGLKVDGWIWYLNLPFGPKKQLSSYSIA